MKKIQVKKFHGFSLIELVLAMALGLIILGALVSTFIVQRTTYDDNEQKVEMVQTARAALDMIGSELVMGGFNPTQSLQQVNGGAQDFTGIVYDTAQLEIRADLNGDGDIATGGGTDADAWTYDTNERIVYKLVGDTLNRKVGGAGASFQPFAENITTFAFEYLDLQGSATTSEADIRNVRITIVSRTEKAAIGKGYDETTMTSIFKIRNMGLKGGPAGGGGATTTTTTPTTTTSTELPTTTTTVEGETTTSTETTTTTTTSTTTTTNEPPPPVDEIISITPEECEEQIIGISLQQCTKTQNDYVLFRLYVSSDGSPVSDAVTTWYIDGVEQSNKIEPQGSGWYGNKALCNCGTYINTWICAVSNDKVKTFNLAVKVVLPSGCVITYSENYTSG